MELAGQESWAAGGCRRRQQVPAAAAASKAGLADLTHNRWINRPRE